MIAEQLWYMCMIYPENISEEDAIKVFEESKLQMNLKVDKSYWEAVLKLIKEENENEK